MSLILHRFNKHGIKVPPDHPILKGYFPNYQTNEIQKHLNMIDRPNNNLILPAPKNAEDFVNNHNKIVISGGSIEHFKHNKAIFLDNKDKHFIPLENNSHLIIKK